MPSLFVRVYIAALVWLLGVGAVQSAAAQGEETVYASGPIQHTERASSARLRASSLLESGEPCGALVVLQQVRADPEVEEMSRYARELCLRGPG